MRYKALLPLAVLPLLAALCDRDKDTLCGDPAVGVLVTYEIVDAATEQDWYAGPGRPSGDSLRLLASPERPGIAGQRVGNRVLLGPMLVNRSNQALVNNRYTATQYLSLGNGDIDTVQVMLHYYPEPTQSDPCGFGPGIDEVTVLYNGRLNGMFYNSTPVDSLKISSMRNVVRLLKR